MTSDADVKDGDMGRSARRERIHVSRRKTGVELQPFWTSAKAFPLCSQTDGRDTITSLIPDQCLQRS